MCEIRQAALVEDLDASGAHGHELAPHELPAAPVGVDVRHAQRVGDRRLRERHDARVRLRGPGEAAADEEFGEEMGDAARRRETTDPHQLLRDEAFVLRTDPAQRRAGAR